MKISARILRIKHTNASGDWVVSEARLESSDAPDAGPAIGERVALVGPLGRIGAGDLLECSGDWDSGKFGLQFKAKRAFVEVGNSLADLEVFLGRIPAIGVYRARQLLQKCGRETVLSALAEEKPELLVGLDPGIAKDACREYHDRLQLVEAFKFVQELPLTEHERARILDEFGPSTKSEIEIDPYILCSIGFAFPQVDTIATTQLGIEMHDQRRTCCAAALATRECHGLGHTWGTENDLSGEGESRLAYQVRKNIGLHSTYLEEGFAQLIAQGEAEKRGNAICETAIRETELRIAANVKRLLNYQLTRPTYAFIGEADSKSGLSTEQATAVHEASTWRISVLTGGPGTGKTYTVKAIVEALSAMGGAIALAAPTGKAAQRITEQTGVQATTIHRLLQYDPQAKGFFHNRFNPLPFAAVVIDEFSMVDTWLAADVLDAIGPNTTLVIVGDVDQLPSIGPGRVLFDLLESGGVPSTRLTKIFRTAEDSAIPYVAATINSGQAPALSAKGKDAALVQIDDEEACAAMIVRASTEILAKPGESGRRAFTADEIQVITPQNIGPLGSETLNGMLQDALNPGDSGIYIGGQYRARAKDRVIHTRNDYTLGVANGEMGVVLAHGDLIAAQVPKHKPGNCDHAPPTKIVLIVEYPDKIIAYDRAHARQLRLAYAVTGHKAQGSQFPAVLVVCHKAHTHMLTRSWIYTAITRASEFVGIVGSAQALAKAAANRRDEDRDTGLQELLRATVDDKTTRA